MAEPMLEEKDIYVYVWAVQVKGVTDLMTTDVDAIVKSLLASGRPCTQSLKCWVGSGPGLLHLQYSTSMISCRQLT